MDFHSLARRDLQFLCKKNRIPANLTNVAMAKALEALETVEGIEEIQEVLVLQSPKVNSPELPHTGRKTSSRRVTHTEKTKIQQQQEPSPITRSNRVTVKTLNVTDMTSKEEEIQETLGFKSPCIKSPEHPRTGRRNSVRRAALGEEPMIQLLKPDPLHRFRQVASTDFDITDMTYKEEEVEKKEVPHILPKTPSTRKSVKGVEAQNSRRGAKKNKEVENHTETTMAVEAKGGKAIGVVTRRSTRLSSRKALEDSVTTQCKGRSSSWEHSAVKMEVLGKEDAAEKENDEDKKDIDEYGDSYAVVIVGESEKKDQEAESHEFSSSIEYMNNGVENELEATNEDVPMIQQQQSSRATTKAVEASKIVSKKEDGEKASNLLSNTLRSTRLSSRIPVEAKSREEEALKIVDLTEENPEEQEKEEEKKDHTEKHDSCVAPVEQDKEGNKEESHDYCPSSEVDNGDSIVSVVEEVEESSQEVESHGFSSSSTEGDFLNILVENGDSTVVLIEGEEMSEQELEIQILSSSIGTENSNVNVTNVVLAEEGMIDQEESYSSFLGKNSKVDLYEQFDSTEESSNQTPENEHVKDSNQNKKENEYVEVSGNQSPVNKVVEDCSDQFSENNLVKDSSNQGSELVEGSGVLLPADEAVKDSNVNVTDVVLAEEGMIDQEESYNLSSFLGKNSKVDLYEQFDPTEESSNQTPENEHVKDSNQKKKENEYVEVSGNQSPVNKVVEDCSDQFSENNLVKDSSNQGSELVEGSGVLLPADEAVKDPNVNVTDVVLAEEGMIDQEESYNLSSFLGKNSKVDLYEQFDPTEESSNQTPENEHVKDSNQKKNENEYVEVSGDQNKVVEDCSDQFSENNLVKSNQGSELVEGSGVLLPADEAVKDSDNQSPESKHVESGSHTSDAKLAISAVSDNLFCSELRPLLHEVAILCATQGSNEIKEEEGKLGLLFTKMTLKDAEECGDSLQNSVVAQNASFVSTKLPAAIVIPQHADRVTTVDIFFPQDDCFPQDLPPALVIPPLFPENVDATTNVDNEASATKAIGEVPKGIKESGGAFTSEIPAAIEESMDDYLSDAGKLATNDSVDVQGTSFTPWSLVSSTELCTDLSGSDSTMESSGDLPCELPEVNKDLFEDNLMHSCELATNGCVDVLQKTETLQGFFFELQTPVSSSELCSEFLTIKSASVDHLSAIPEESVEDNLRKLAASEPFDVPQKTEISQGGSLELQSPVSCTELSTDVSTVDSAIEVKEASGDPPSEISAVTDESVETGLPNYDELSSRKSLDAEISQDDSLDPQIPVPSTAELCLGFSATTLATISSPLKLPCDTETMSPVESSTFQTQPSEEASIAATEIAEERKETNTKALEEGVFLKDGNLELLSLTKLRAMYKQMLNGPKAEQERKKSIIKQENLQSSSGIKHDENNNQILNELETKRSVIKQEDLECPIRSSKLDSNCKQKLNDDTIKLERKRTPLKSLNYSTF